MTEVKICGLSTPPTLQAALDAGAEYVGLMFYPPSPRNVTIDQAAPLADMARGKAKIVAVTVDADNELIEAIATRIRPDFIQCHGSETPGQVAAITQRTGIKVIKALKIRHGEDLNEAQLYDEAAAMMLYDAKVPEGFKNALPGGNGVAFDWQLLQNRESAGTFMLGGGINKDNVAQAIAVASPAIIDVSSGVETEPGQKDEALIQAFTACVKAEQA